MRPLLFVFAFVGFAFADSDTLPDTTYSKLIFKGQPTSFTRDSAGNLTAQFSDPIMKALPYDTAHGIGLNIQGANNIWRDSLQRLDTIKFPSKTVTSADIRDSLFQHCKKWGKKQIRSTYNQ
jgi:hypothetical protein